MFLCIFSLNIAITIHEHLCVYSCTSTNFDVILLTAHHIAGLDAVRVTVVLCFFNSSVISWLMNPRHRFSFLFDGYKGMINTSSEG